MGKKHVISTTASVFIALRRDESLEGRVFGKKDVGLQEMA
jgi:hypothetical protein